MHYKELNEKQKKKMKQIINPQYSMEWENPEFMDYLMGQLPQVRRFHSDKNISNELLKLENKLATYDPFFTDKRKFFEEVKDIFYLIQEKDESWFGLNLYDIEMYLKIHRFCIISGEGGIGKSYFIKCFEENLEQKDINHLCIYGKFEKEITSIDFEEIIHASENGFVFVFDAINEMSESGQRCLLNILKVLKECPKIRIVLTYRTNTMDKTIFNEYKMLSSYEYKFPGVSFESALDKILKLSVPDVYLYEDILYSNNALLLSELYDVLSNKKIIDEKENGIATVTFILEQYIKSTINKELKNNSTCDGKDIWEDTKRIAQWMYKHEKKEIDETTLLSVIKTEKNFIVSMIQMGFMDCYEFEGKKYYHFMIDSLTDFLIARSVFDDIRGKEYQQQVAIIKSKIGVLDNLEAALIIAIFDNLSPDYERIQKLLNDTGLMEYLDFDTLVKIHYKSNNIKEFQRIFKLKNHTNLLKQIGGFTDKPFNCSNYLFAYYCERNERIGELSTELSGFYFQKQLKKRLKNVLYFTTLNTREDRRDDEAFYFTLLCCAAPNKDIRCLAEKLLYEITSKKDEYIDKLFFEYDKIPDFYIQESVIYVLSRLQKNNDKILNFFNELIRSKEYLTAKSIRRISAYIGDLYAYITWNRTDLYQYNSDARVSDYLDSILFEVDSNNKDVLPFRYFGKDHIEIYTQFLVNDKHEIKRINDYLSNHYSCVRNGACNGSLSFEKNIMQEIQANEEIKTLDINSFMECFEKVIRYVFDYYGTSIDANMRQEDFNHSVYMKCVDVATGFYYGSLMCNHYTNQFATYNNKQESIGYEVYDPLEYGEDIIITSPIPTYQDHIERLGDHVIYSLEQPIYKDIKWTKDVELTTRRNVLHLIEPVILKKQKWILLAGKINLRESDKHNDKWIDSYNIFCCTSENVTIHDNWKTRNLTIELEDYDGELKDYSENKRKPWLCKKVPNINLHSNVLDETYLVLPPSEIIQYFNFHLNVSDLSWETQDKEKVILCNNTKASYYKNPIVGTVFIRTDYYEKFIQSHTLKYFAYSERYTPKTGFADETSFHFEIMNGKIIKVIPNKKLRRFDDMNNMLCENCPHLNFGNPEQREVFEDDMEQLKKFYQEYSFDDGLE